MVGREQIFKMTDEVERPVRGYILQWPACEVRHLILSGDRFIVFLDNDLDVDWCTTSEYDKAETEDRRRECSEIVIRAASVECIPNDHQEANIRLNFKRMVGEGVARALEHEYDSAKKILEQARLYIEARNVEKARYWQLCTACILGVILGLSALMLWWFRAYPIGALGEPAYYLVMSGAAGSVGAVLSMIFRMGHSFPNSEAPRALHILETASRVLAGCFSGLLAAGSVQVGLILSVVSGNGQMHAAMLVVAFASGGSERFAPSIIARFETSAGERQPKKGRTQ
jgi:hypothetical protein